MPKQVNDVKGVIKRIVSPVSKTFTAKKGKNAGNPFTIWSIGIQMSDGEWYNIKGDSEDKVKEYLHCQKLERDYVEGDEVKIYLETEDAAGKYWRITSIVPWGPTDEVPVEDVLDEAEQVVEDEKKAKELDKTESGVPTGASHSEGDVTDAEVKEADEKYHVEPVGTAKPESPKEAQKEQQSPTPTVQDYKSRDADKYELGMAKNNAAIIFAAMIGAENKDFEGKKDIMKANTDFYDKLVKALYDKGKAMRQKILGY